MAINSPENLYGLAKLALRFMDNADRMTIDDIDELKMGLARIKDACEQHIKAKKTHFIVRKRVRDEKFYRYGVRYPSQCTPVFMGRADKAEDLFVMNALEAPYMFSILRDRLPNIDTLELLQVERDDASPMKDRTGVGWKPCLTDGRTVEALLAEEKSVEVDEQRRSLGLKA